MDMPYDRQVLGVVCSHCGSKNTVVEFYKYSREPWCLDCARAVEVPSGINN